MKAVLKFLTAFVLGFLASVAACKLIGLRMYLGIWLVIFSWRIAEVAE